MRGRCFVDNDEMIEEVSSSNEIKQTLILTEDDFLRCLSGVKSTTSIC